MAWPVTPYIGGERVVVTSPLAFIRKAEHVRRDGRVAMLVGGVHVRGNAEVRADASGDGFVADYLQQELRKYPPARTLVKVPLHRKLFAWYFGRGIMSFAPERVATRAGDDTATLITLDADGFPSIVPIAVAEAPAGVFAVGTESGEGAACMLIHRETADMSDLRSLLVRGDIAAGTFTVRSRVGSLDAPASDEGEFARRRRARAATRLMRDWPQARDG